MSKLPYIEQMEHSECGLACIAMVLGYYGYHVSLSDLREEYGVPKGGFSVLNLVEIAKEKQLQAKAFKSHSESFGKINLPIILFWENKHFVVLEKIKNDCFYISDPAIGKIKISKTEFLQKYSNIMIEFRLTNQFTKKKKINPYKILLSYAFQKPSLVIRILLVSLFLQGLGLIIPLITKWITDEVLITKKSEYMNVIGLSVITILLSYMILSYARGYFIAKLQTLIDKKMMSHFMDHLLGLPYKFFENRSSGELLFRANSNVYIRQVLSTKLVSFFIDSILLFSYAFLMLNMSFFIGGIVILVGLLLFIMLAVSTKITHKITNKDVINQTKVQKILSESIYGISDIKVMGLERKFFSEWEGNFKNQLESSQKRSIWNTTLNIFPATIQFGMPIFILWIGGYLVIDGTITVGTIVSFSTLALAFITPISALGLGYTEIVSLKSYIQRLYDVIKSSLEINQSGKYVQNFKGHISLKNVSFRYDKFSEDILKSISFDVKPGEKIAIVGNSGSGKSTLAKLLLGIYKPTSGEIYYDGKEMSNVNIKSLREKMGSVLQETRLFNKTILENIDMNGEFSEADIISACQNADIIDDILSCPLGFQTIISETGVNFSGGQRQRLALARAIVRKPSVLILDEATSALDNISESKIDKSISELECTRIIIAHRLSTIKNADRILVLHNGQIVEEGDHDTLIKNNGHYSNLYNVKQKGVLKDEKMYV